MQNTPPLQTERLVLRRFALTDLEAFFDIGRDEEVNTFLPLFPFTALEDAKEHLQEKYLKSYENPTGFRYAICLKTENVPIGYVNVADNDSYDFGYGLRKEYWHKGIVTEACRAVIHLLSLADIPYITATHDVNNPRSGNVMKKIGMTYRYSYEELWQPKNILVTFRMYQLNLSSPDAPVYQKYWDTHSVHFVENDVLIVKEK